MDEIKPLICSPSPRDIPDWLQCWNNLGDYADRYIAKYYNEKQAYKFLRDYFIDHSSEYTHMVILPDDLIVTPQQFNLLRLNADKYPVLGGYFNRNWQDRNLWSCIVEGRNPPAWMTLDEIGQETVRQGTPILKVRQDYFGCTFIRRDVVKQVGEFHAFTPGASGYDYAFSLDCARLGIPLHIDARVRMLHLANRKGDGTQEHCGLMKCSPYCMFIPKR